jgi:hypothetical protein
MKPKYGTPEWDRAHALAQCWAHNVAPAVFDFIAHNLGTRAAFAALRALPINPPKA